MTRPWRKSEWDLLGFLLFLCLFLLLELFGFLLMVCLNQGLASMLIAAIFVDRGLPFEAPIYLDREVRDDDKGSDDDGYDLKRTHGELLRQSLFLGFRFRVEEDEDEKGDEDRHDNGDGPSPTDHDIEGSGS